MTQAVYDVAIAGAGPAGAAAALALARSGRRVLLADALTPAAPALRIGEGLAPGAASLLRELGVLGRTLGDVHRPCVGTIASWGKGAAHAHDFFASLAGDSLLLDRMRFDAMLRDAACEAGAQLVADKRMRVEAQSGADYHRVMLWDPGGDEQPVLARWVIDATGRRASVARGLGAVRRRDESLVALWLLLEPGDDAGSDADADARIWVEAVPEGWWYSALLPSGQRLVALVCDASLPRAAGLLETQRLWQQLQQAPLLHDLCARHAYRPTARVRSTEAGSAALDRAAGERWLAVGDAAISFDPLSSKGIANALYSGLEASKAIIAAQSGDQDAPYRYAAHLGDIYAHYRVQQRRFYAMETRWPEAEFWRARLAG
ncbi:NAD(P)/FAD-dependent oxidoreductase [Paraburkholderia bannensis]|uniref:NAD(P)/FAD-dependent oxidoreductase n=1 Tax=Paraburkholderia bannensis TaxID=765414 RepID=UPI002AB1D550|nr:FAD-dependent monooxygenase [Paraburkholderia bannensis]